MWESFDYVGIAALGCPVERSSTAFPSQVQFQKVVRNYCKVLGGIFNWRALNPVPPQHTQIP
jgi:hypothetical protein